jgi:hypothetical protein
MRQSMKKGATAPVRKYADGSMGGVSPFQGDDEDPFSAVRDPIDGSTEYRGPTEADLDKAETQFAEPAKFGDAFREARKAGVKEFTWQGKRYNTQLKEEAPKATAKIPVAKSANLSDDPDRMKALGDKAKRMAASMKAKK